jgi:hypothetical protein
MLDAFKRKRQACRIAWSELVQRGKDPDKSQIFIRP